MLLADRRTQPRKQLGRRYTERPKSLFEDAASKPTPTGVSSSYSRPIARREQHRHAVGNLNDANTPTNTRHRSISPRTAAFRTPAARRPWRAAAAGHVGTLPRGALQTIQINHVNSMHLLQPHRLRGQPQVLPYAPPVLRNRLRSIPDMRTNIERVIRRHAHPTRTQRKRTTHPRRDRPVRRDHHRLAGRTHLVPLSAASSSAASSTAIRCAMSAGSGASHSISFPVIGCASFNRAACNA